MAEWAVAAVAAYGVWQQNEANRKAEEEGKKQLKLQQQAQDQANARADKQEKLQEEALNAANAKKPDTSTMIEKRKALARKSSTLLSGGSTAKPKTTGSTLLGG